MGKTVTDISQDYSDNLFDKLQGQNKLFFLATFGVNKQRPAELEDIADVTGQPPAGTKTGHTCLGGTGQDAATPAIDRF